MSRPASRTEIRVDHALPIEALPDDVWRETAAKGATWTVFQEPRWLQCWWEVFGRGKLVVVSAWSSADPVAIAPFFIDGDMAFLVGSGGSDYLDFIGDIGNAEVIDAMLMAVVDSAPGLLGIRLYHVPAASPTPAVIRAAACRLGLDCIEEESLAAPVLDLGAGGEAGLAAARKTSLVRHERSLAKAGVVTVEHLSSAVDIHPYLESFFDQHARRWHAAGQRSLFDDPAQRAFYRRLVDAADDLGSLRFTRIALDNRPVAYHFGCLHRGVFLWYKSSFETDLAQRSPGEVLLRQLLFESVREQASVFDFGLGDEAFKHRFASRVPLVTTWGLYPRHPR